jgi:hypothetical protein
MPNDKVQISRVRFWHLKFGNLDLIGHLDFDIWHLIRA